MSFERKVVRITVSLENATVGSTFESRVKEALDAQLGDDYIIRHMEKLDSGREKVSFLVVADKT
jgi:hypothetical protein